MVISFFALLFPVWHSHDAPIVSVWFLWRDLLPSNLLGTSLVVASRLNEGFASWCSETWKTAMLEASFFLRKKQRWFREHLSFLWGIPIFRDYVSFGERSLNHKCI